MLAWNLISKINRVWSSLEEKKNKEKWYAKFNYKSLKKCALKHRMTISDLDFVDRVDISADGRKGFQFLTMSEEIMKMRILQNNEPTGKVQVNNLFAMYKYTLESLTKKISMWKR